MDYKKYKPTKKWVISEVVKICALSLGTGYIFFESLIWSLVVLPFGIIVWKKDIESYIAKRKKMLTKEFREMIVVLSGNLNAGYSLERAFAVTYGDMRKSGEEYQYILSELKVIINGIECNRRAEDMLLDLGTRSDVRDILDFARLIVSTKIYGGNIVSIIRQTAGNIAEKHMVEEEINTIIASKKLEGRIMLMMPFLIIIYMKLTNSGYMDIMYRTALGNIVMCISLIFIILSGFLINKIVKIEV
ncbi:MAG: hypothetical protein IJ763_05455 [Lachnospiraceae bacterium]|nr:hypothetical protein [Lachnospiraceae bacterium]